jgi:hypothetical protein
MYLSLLYRGPRRYALLDGAREVGSLEGTTLRFGPFESGAEVARAADAGRLALRRWIESRSAERSAADGRSHATTERDEDVAHGRAPFVEFTLPSDVYTAVALHVAQRLLEAIRESAREYRTELVAPLPG